jgi:hypothetical protein
MPNWKYIWWNIEDRWERLGLKNIRNCANNNPKIVIGICIGAVLLLLLIVIAQLMPYRSPITLPPHKVWFYDLNTNELFVADGDKIPPIKAPSDKLVDGEPAGVKAHVLSYIRDPNESERFIGYLEKYTPEGKKLLSTVKKSGTGVTKEMIQELNKNRFVRTADDNRWFLADSDRGRAILEQVFRTNEKGERPHACIPK